MNVQNQVISALIRGLGYRVARGLPWWLAALVLLGFYLFGGKA
ncbi:hypothetical protein P11VFA_016 [Rhizobium phage P11VFA]|nr:hypothetical protein P11VFA_016 [Rhizobium phage P11VFA]